MSLDPGLSGSTSTTRPWPACWSWKLRAEVAWPAAWPAARLDCAQRRPAARLDCAQRWRGGQHDRLPACCMLRQVASPVLWTLAAGVEAACRLVDPALPNNKQHQMYPICL